MLGTMAVFAWLIKKRGTMNVDWRVRTKRGHHDGQRHIDIYDIQSRSALKKRSTSTSPNHLGRSPSRVPPNQPVHGPV
jgi:hypothetical protein